MDFHCQSNRYFQYAESFEVIIKFVNTHNLLLFVLPGAAIFFEFKHYKPKKGFTSTKCFAFMEMDEIKPGPIVIEL